MKKSAAHVCAVLATGVMAVRLPAGLPPGVPAADPWDVTGVPVTRELPRRAEHRFAITLEAGEFARVLVEQRGTDVAVRVRAPDAQVLAEFDRATGGSGTEEVDLVASAAGAFVIAVTAAPGAARAGSYAIRLGARRAATWTDRLLQESRTLQVAAAALERDGRFDAARVELTRALDDAEAACGGELETATIAEQLAGVYRKLPDAGRAEALYRRAIDIDARLLGRRDPRTARAQVSLAVLYQRQGDRARAEALLEPSLATIETALGPGHPWYVSALAALGNLRDAAGDLADEERIIRRALAALDAIEQQDSAQYASLLNDLGEVYRQKGDYANAETTLSRALALDDRLLGSGSYASATPLQNLGIVAREHRNYPLAIAYNMRALAIRERAVGPDHPDVAHVLTNLANIYRATGDMARALDTQVRALRIWEHAAGPYQQATLLAVGNIARTYAAAGDVEHAVEYQRRADRIVEKELALNLAAGSERQKLLFLRSIAGRTDRTLSLHLAQAPGNPEAAALAASALLQRKGRVLDAMIDALAGVRRAAGSRDRERLDELKATMSRLAEVALGRPGGPGGDDRRAAIDRLEAQRERLEAALSAHSARFRAHAQPVTLESVQAAIPPDAALLEFAIFHPFNPRAERTADAYGASHYAVYVLRTSGVPRGVDLGDATAIDTRLQALIASLRNPDRQDVGLRARAIYDLLIQPIASSIGGVTRLLVSPDGELNRLPFEALVDGRGRYLVQQYPITYLTSGRDLLRMEVPRGAGGPAVIVADPLFGENTSASRRPAPYFAPLAATAEEGRAITALFPGAAMLTGRFASKSALLKVRSPRLLHIASHGFFQPDAPGDAAGNPLLRSGVALAGANLSAGESTAGVLTALEASGLNLWGTKLVTLSACDTGLGELRNGEGVYGLRRAFVVAGSETQVMSLWPVSDTVSRETMVAYYTALRAGLGRGDALRQAKLALLKRPARQHPYYWASFTQSGEWGSLDGRR
ncbi:MAG TPA: CHAT domain-containing tetratricopeptide repeat protein [Vicinamibacterales bacterium]|nr:CHAT domain-containing tetratricopeptide repeat protein [Vicinamibacterales bacterium]